MQSSQNAKRNEQTEELPHYVVITTNKNVGRQYFSDVLTNAVVSAALRGDYSVRGKAVSTLGKRV